MNRVFLLRTLSVAALAAGLVPAVASAQDIINGGGSTSDQADYSAPNIVKGKKSTPQSEFSLFNSTHSAANFGTYWGSGSGTGQTAFIQDDLTCDINKVTNANGGKCSNTPGGVNTVHYGTSDAVLSAAQAASWTTSTVGQSVAGDLIQIPTFGEGTAIVPVDTNLTTNGQLQLSDNDLCGIFSGLITDFSQITDSGTAPAPGPFVLVYRSDSAAPTFLLTNHLSAVCNSSNTAAGVTFTATTTFATLFPQGINVAIPNAVGETLNSGVANYLAGLSSAGSVPQAIGYVSPDWTSLTPKSPQTLSNGLPSPLLVAAIFTGSNALLPTTANIATALTHVKQGTNASPPANAQAGANELLWVPTVQTVSAGYAIVGYGNIDLAQCYSDPTIGSGIIAFLTAHYKTKSYLTIEGNNGIVPLKNTKATAFITAIQSHILANKSGAWNTNIDNATACAGLRAGEA